MIFVFGYIVIVIALIIGTNYADARWDFLHRIPWDEELWYVLTVFWPFLPVAILIHFIVLAVVATNYFFVDLAERQRIRANERKKEAAKAASTGGQ